MILFADFLTLSIITIKNLKISPPFSSLTALMAPLIDITIGLSTLLQWRNTFRIILFLNFAHVCLYLYLSITWAFSNILFVYFIIFIFQNSPGIITTCAFLFSFISLIIYPNPMFLHSIRID